MNDTLKTMRTGWLAIYEDGYVTGDRAGLGSLVNALTLVTSQTGPTCKVEIAPTDATKAQETILIELVEQPPKSGAALASKLKGALALACFLLVIVGPYFVGLVALGKIISTWVKG